MILKNVLVTGGAGFIGSQLVKKILPITNHIYIIDDLSTGQRAAVPDSPKITFIEDSITNKKLLCRIMPKVEYVFHLACSNIVKSVDELELDFDTNLYGGFQILQHAYKHCGELKRIVYASTASIYSEADIIPTPEDYYKIRLPYGASKFSTEHYCDVYHHLYKLPITVLRLSNVYGPGQSILNPYCGVVAKFFEAVMKKKSMVIYGDGEQTRDFTYIDDALKGFLLAAQREEAIGKVYNVGTGIETSINSLAQEVIRIVGCIDAEIEYHPNRRVDIVNRRSIDSTKIQRELGWKMDYNLADGLYKTLQWLKEEL